MACSYCHRMCLSVRVCVSVNFACPHDNFNLDKKMQNFLVKVKLTHRGPVDLRKWAIFNTILMSPKSWLSQEDLDAGCEHSMVPVDS